MKQFLIIAVLFFYTFANAQKINFIKANNEREIVLFFKSPILNGEIKGEREFFHYNSTEISSVGKIILKENKDGDLLVTTKDGLTYFFKIQYEKSITELSYFINKKQAIDYTSDMDEADEIGKNDIDFDSNGLIVLNKTKPKKKKITENEVAVIDNKIKEKPRKKKLKPLFKKKEKKEDTSIVVQDKKKKEQQKTKKTIKPLFKKKDKKQDKPIVVQAKKTKKIDTEKPKKTVAIQREIPKKEIKPYKGENKKVTKKEVAIVKKKAKKKPKNTRKRFDRNKKTPNRNNQYSNRKKEKEKKIKLISSYDITGGITGKGYGANLSYNSPFADGYLKYGVNLNFSKIIKDSLTIPFNVYTVDIGYYYPAFKTKALEISFGLGALGGYEMLNKGKKEVGSNLQIENAKNAIVYGGFLGTEVAYKITDNMAIMAEANQYYRMNSNVGNGTYYVGLGLRINN